MTRRNFLEEDFPTYVIYKCFVETLRFLLCSQIEAGPRNFIIFEIDVQHCALICFSRIHSVQCLINNQGNFLEDVFPKSFI